MLTCASLGPGCGGDHSSEPPVDAGIEGAAPYSEGALIYEGSVVALAAGDRV
jgi:hypothetical protein